jgi:hypothetical protein
VAVGGSSIGGGTSIVGEGRFGLGVTGGGRVGRVSVAAGVGGGVTVAEGVAAAVAGGAVVGAELVVGSGDGLGPGPAHAVARTSRNSVAITTLARISRATLAA